MTTIIGTNIEVEDEFDFPTNWQWWSIQVDWDTGGGGGAFATWKDIFENILRNHNCVPDHLSSRTPPSLVKMLLLTQEEETALQNFLSKRKLLPCHTFAFRFMMMRLQQRTDKLTTWDSRCWTSFCKDPQWRSILVDFFWLLAKQSQQNMLFYDFSVCGSLYRGSGIYKRGASTKYRNPMLYMPWRV